MCMMTQVTLTARSQIRPDERRPGGDMDHIHQTLQISQARHRGTLSITSKMHNALQDVPDAAFLAIRRRCAARGPYSHRFHNNQENTFPTGKSNPNTHSPREHVKRLNHSGSL